VPQYSGSDCGIRVSVITARVVKHIACLGVERDEEDVADGADEGV
jgi:hypothetical protein